MPLIPTQRLDKRLSVMKMTKYKNENYEWVTEWTKDYELWTSVKRQYYSDFKESFGTVLQDSISFIVRYDEYRTITSDLRIEYNNVQYNIISVLEGTYVGDFTTIVCKRV